MGKNLKFFYIIYLVGIFFTHPLNCDTPPKIVSLAPVITELIYSLDAQSQLQGVTTACTYPEAAKSIPKIGDFTRPFIESIVSLEPDLVLGLSSFHQNSHRQFNRIRLKTAWLKNPDRVEDIPTLITQLGHAIGKPNAATQLAAEFQAELDPFLVPLPDNPPTILVLLWASPYIGVGPATFVSDIVAKSGYKNSLHHAQQPYPKLSLESILLMNPDWILAAQPGIITQLQSDPVLSNLDAVRNNQVISSINSDLYLRPGPRVILAISELSSLRRHGKIDLN